MKKKSFIEKLKNMGPAAIIASAFIGPGTITTSTISGTNFQGKQYSRKFLDQSLAAGHS